MHGANMKIVISHVSGKVHRERFSVLWREGSVVRFTLTGCQFGIDEGTNLKY